LETAVGDGGTELFFFEFALSDGAGGPIDAALEKGEVFEAELLEDGSVFLAGDGLDDDGGILLRAMGSVAEFVGEFGMEFALFFPDEGKLVVEHVAPDVAVTEAEEVSMDAAFLRAEVEEVVPKSALGGIGEFLMNGILERFDLAEHALELLLVLAFGGIDFGFSER